VIKSLHIFFSLLFLPTKKFECLLEIFFYLQPSLLATSFDKNPPVIKFNSKILHLTSQSDSESLEMFLNIFNDTNMLNVVIAYEDKEEVHLIITNRFKDDVFIKVKEVQELENDSMSKFLYPDKLKNLNGYEINVVYHGEGIDGQVAGLMAENQLTGSLIDFLEIIKTKMNASLNMIELAKYQKAVEKKDNWIIDFTLKENKNGFDFNLAHPMNRKSNKMFYNFYQYDECFSATIPSAIAVYKQILFKPFHKSIWVCLSISFGVCAIVWWLYSKTEDLSSTWDFLFGLFGFFVGQNVELRM
jgi:hypothetical protein